MKRFRFSLFCLLPALLPLTSHAEEAGVSVMPLAADARVRLDGRLDDPIWQSAPVHETFWDHLPKDGRKATYRTTVQYASDGTSLYFAIRAYDPAPDLIRAPLVRRDAVFVDQDFVVVYLDAIGARKSAQFIRVNARGVAADGMYTADTDNEDFAPDFDFTARGELLPDGYSVELRVPYATLRFAHGATEPWRVMVGRNVPRESRYLSLNVPLLIASPTFIAEMTPLHGLKPAEDTTSLILRPNVTLRTNREEGEGRRSIRNRTVVGLDLKWRPRADWVIDATLNPDFSQVELDSPLLSGNTSFALFVPEKRPFFLESSDVLESPTRALYSRTVTDPAWGTRATYRGMRNEATLLTARDDGGGAVLLPGPFGTDQAIQPRSQATLARGRWNGSATSVGGVFTSREYSGRGYNRVIGPDLVWRPTGDDRLRAQVLWSETAAHADAEGRLQQGRKRDGHLLYFDWLHRSETTEPKLEVAIVSPGYRNDGGFTEQAGYRRVGGELNRKWRPDGPIHEISAFVWLNRLETLNDREHGVAGGQLIRSEIRPGIFVAGPRNSDITLEWRAREGQRTRSGGPVHQYQQLHFNGVMNPNAWFTRFTLEADVGQRVDVDTDRVGRGAYWLVEGRFRLLDRVELEPQWSQVYVNAPEGGRALTDSAAQLVSYYHLDALNSVRLVAQRHWLKRGGAPELVHEKRRLESLVFAHKRSTGRVLYAGVTQSLEERYRSREVFVKLQWEL